MMIATLQPQTARGGAIYRAARLALLTQQMLQHFQRTKASVDKVEQALTKLARANDDQVARQ